MKLENLKSLVRKASPGALLVAIHAPVFYAHLLTEYVSKENAMLLAGGSGVVLVLAVVYAYDWATS